MKPVPCKSCTQKKSMCKGKQLKIIGKRCQLLFSYVVDDCIDRSDILKIAEVIKPAWFVNKNYTIVRKKQICARVLNDLNDLKLSMEEGDKGMTNVRFNEGKK